MSPVSPCSFPAGERYPRRAWAIDQAVSPAAAVHDPSSTSCARQFSLLIAFDLPTIPSPTTALPFRHSRFVTLHHRCDCPRLSSGQTSGVGRSAVARIRVRTLIGASPTGLAESSSLLLRTGRSSQVAFHLPSRERSYHFRLQAGNVSLRGTSTLQIKRLHRRTTIRLRRKKSCVNHKATSPLGGVCSTNSPPVEPGPGIQPRFLRRGAPFGMTNPRLGLRAMAALGKSVSHAFCSKQV